MFRHRVTSLVILVILSLFVQNVDAHLSHYNINAKRKVEVRNIPNSEIKDFIATAS